MIITWISAVIIGTAVYAAYHFGKKKGKEDARKEYFDEYDEGDYSFPEVPQLEDEFFPELDVYINDSKDSCHIENARLIHTKFVFETESFWFYEKSREMLFEAVNTIKPKLEYSFTLKFTGNNNMTYILHNCFVESTSFGDISSNAIDNKMNIIVTFDYIQGNKL